MNKVKRSPARQAAETHDSEPSRFLTSLSGPFTKIRARHVERLAIVYLVVEELFDRVGSHT